MLTEFAFIGGGTAGLAVAHRLSEDSDIQVGVIEAGVYHQNDPLVDEPCTHTVVHLIPFNPSKCYHAT